MHVSSLHLRWLSASTFLAALTMIASLAVAYLVNGSALSTVGLIDLRAYGGTTFEDLRNLELWRLATAQLLHAKMPHMLFNALCVLLLGTLLENKIGSLMLFTIWLVAGGVATVMSPVLVNAPWNVGTGASQAVFAFAGCAVVLAICHVIDRMWTFILVAISAIPGTLLDLVTAGYPKPGHVAGFLLGTAFGVLLLRFLRGQVVTANDP